MNGQPYSSHSTFGEPVVSRAISGLNPDAAQFHHSLSHQGQYQNGNLPHQDGPQVSSQPQIIHLADRVQRLEFETDAIRRYVEKLNAGQCDLSETVDALKKGGWSVNVGPFKPQGIDTHKQIDEIKSEATDEKPSPTASTNGSVPPHLRNADSGMSDGSVSVPPHMRGVAQRTNGTASMPPHLRNQGASNALVTDGKIDTSPFRLPPSPDRTPPTSPTAFSTSTIQPNVPRQTIEDPYTAHSGKDWMPHATLEMQSLPVTILSSISPTAAMVTFSHDFLSNTFGGSFWSPGLKYIPPGSGICMLPTRSYYMLDFSVEPYLPKSPGQHGAKMTAFFNQNPEEVYGEDAGGDFFDVPMFVCASPYALDKAQRRYVYFGNYSQTRWSDKLDYDRMVEQVPREVKTYWAEELSSQARPQWISDALMQHFFPKPEYMGAVFGAQVQGSDSVTPEEEAKADEKVMRDVKAYVRGLREWEKDARLKTMLIKKEFVLQAFERADADDPPALRLWWEYLQCTNWDRSFYDMLVQLQARNPNYLK
ncbi:hypothetical protein K491DRAFT_595960 [Lophiostoma macrostomum CBS 122681]|uniref:DUF6697 domain-containing protein n=1 Tax=Lophiostoma macrostomum CBS 122681 TaxID=1314788 RepID=A0A6A6TC69_9PLEO|nr:hypothetical protein K491DRAFT_595960 [Lophiostoma macrostomum CBS 122681]